MKHYYLLVLGWLLLACPAAGQALRWERTLGAAGYTRGQGICAAPDGGVVTTGFRNAGQSASLADSSRGSTDVSVVKYSASGQVQWNHSFGGTLNEEGYQVRPTPTGATW